MGRYTLLLVLGLVLAGACWLAFPARTAADREPSSKLSAAQEIAQAWIPRGEGSGIGMTSVRAARKTHPSCMWSPSAPPS